MVAYAVEMLDEVCDLVVVAAPPGLTVSGACVVAGGASRSASVRAMLAALPAEVTTVLVHDAARPLAPVEIARRVLAALASGERAVVPVLPVADTVKLVDGRGYVRETPDRAALRAVQTPQGFVRSVLVDAHAAGGDATDDAALVEALGVPVLTVSGDPAARKITTPADLAAAEQSAPAR